MREIVCRILFVWTSRVVGMVNVRVYQYVSTQTPIEKQMVNSNHYTTVLILANCEMG